MISYTPSAWYWVIPGVSDEVFSSARPGMVPVIDADYVAFLAGGNAPSRLNPDLSKAQAFSELYTVLNGQAPAAAAAVLADWKKAGYLNEEVAPTGTRLAFDATQAELIAKSLGVTVDEVKKWSVEEALAALAGAVSARGDR